MHQWERLTSRRSLKDRRSHICSFGFGIIDRCYRRQLVNCLSKEKALLTRYSINPVGLNQSQRISIGAASNRRLGNACQ